MPIYVYICQGGHEFEEFSTTLQKAPEGPACPEKGCGRPTRKVPRGFNAHFHGRGWTPTFFENRDHK